MAGLVVTEACTDITRFKRKVKLKKGEKLDEVSREKETDKEKGESERLEMEKGEEVGEDVAASGVIAEYIETVQ